MYTADSKDVAAQLVSNGPEIRTVAVGKSAVVCPRQIHYTDINLGCEPKNTGWLWIAMGGLLVTRLGQL